MCLFQSNLNASRIDFSKDKVRSEKSYCFFIYTFMATLQYHCYNGCIYRTRRYSNMALEYFLLAVLSEFNFQSYWLCSLQQKSTVICFIE